MALLLALATLGLTAAAPSADAADRDFAPRFTANDTGDIDIFGNTLMTCPSSASGCAAAQQAGVTTTANSSSQNNAYNMEFVDVDGDASTFDSSRATVTIPSGSTVLFAGLYWGGRAVGSSRFASRNTVKFRTPAASSYTTLTSTTLDDGTPPSTNPDGSIYQGFVDVTSRVQAGGSGVYTVADVVAQPGADQLAGWSLVVAYRNTSQPARNLTVFDGIKSIGSGATGTIGVSGFTTPPAGAVNTRIGFVNYEGDGGLVGDQAYLNTTVLSDAQHPSTNFFNSRSSRDGVLRTGQTPSYPNQLGIEQSILQATNVLANNATSATIRLTSSGDVYAPGVVTFATELYAPKVEQTKTVKDVNGGDVEQGDVLEYTITGSNTGQDGARDFVVRDPIPTNTAYVPGTLKVTPAASGGGATAATAVTDGAGDDRGEYASTGNQVVARVGTGATTTAGGNVTVTTGAASTYAVVFQVKVGGPSPAIASDTTISNTATASFASQSLGTALTSTAAATAPLKTPDLTLTKAGQGTILRGRPYTYRVTVKNEGDAKTQGLVTVTDTLPTGVTAGTNAASGTGWTCTNTSTTFTCTRSDALAAGASYPAIDLVTNIAPDAPSPIANTASVTGGGDGDLSNNTGTATSGPTSSADLAITKTASAASAPLGGNVTYTLRVTNSGPSRSAGSVITDALPAGLTYVSSGTGCTGVTTSSTVTCTVGALAPGASAEFTVVAKPAAGTAGSALRNTATVAGTDPDPTTGNDSASVSVDVLPVDLRITNTIQGSPATLNPNTTYTWLVGVTNDGGSAAPNSIVRFDVPAGTTASAATIDSRCSLSGATGSQIVTCNLGTIGAAGGTGADPLKIPLTTTATPGASISTSASVATTEPDRTPGNNVATTSTPVVQSVDLGVTFLANPGPVRAGENLTLTAVVKNNGVARPVAPKLTIPLPAGTTFVSAADGCALSGGSIVCDLTAADLDAGESLTKAIVVRATANPGPTISATATVSTTSLDTDPSNDSAAQTVQVIESVDLAVTLAADPDTARPGQLLTLTASVRNNGPGRPDAPTVTIPIPAGTTFDSAPAGCALIPGGAAVVCTLPADGLDTGESLTRAIKVRVGDTPGTTISAAAAVATTSTDTVASNNNAALTVPVAQTVDLGVTITPSPTPVRPGQDLTFSVVVKNDGAARPGAPKVTIPLPAGTTFVSGPGCALNTGGTAIVCDLTASGLDAGESVTVPVVVRVGANPGPSVAATATVSTTSTDTNTANDAASAIVPVIESVDLAVTLAADPGTARPGQPLTLTATIRNNGPGRPDAPTVTIPIPAGTTFASAPAGCTLLGTGAAVVCTLPADGLDTGESLTRAIVVTVGDAPGASLSASAAVATTSTDTNTPNNSAALTVPVVQTVDLGVTITPSPTPVRPGQDLTLNVVVKNDGAARPGAPKVTIPLPAGTTLKTAPDGCTLTGGSIVCDLPADQLDAGESLTRAIVVTVGPNPGPSIPVSAATSTTSTDTNAANNTATATVPVIETVDLAVTLASDPGTARPGQNVTLTATVRNNGPGRPDAPTVTIPIPAGTTIVGTPPAGCTAGTTAVVCTLSPSDLDTGESLTRAITVKVGDTPGASLTASATVATTSTDTVAANNAASLTVPVVQTVDLGVTITPTPSPVRPGQDLTLNVVVKNDGAARPADPKVTIPLPAGTTFVSAPGCTVGGGSIVCDLTAADLDAGESITKAIVVKVGPNPGPTIPVSATVATTSTDTNAANNTATATVPVIETVDLATTLTAAPGPVRIGENLTLTATVKNNGPGRPDAPKVTIPLPAGTTFVSAPAGCTLTGGSIVCDLPAADLDTGESVTRAIVVKVENPAGTTIAASATASTTSTDTNAGNDRATASVTVLRDVDLGVTLTADPGTTSIGEDLELTVVVKNNGDGRPADPKVTIPLPTGTTVVPGTLPNGCVVNGAGTAVVCDLTPSELDAGASVTRDIVVRVGPGAGTSLDLSASVSTTSPDTNTANDRATLTVPVTAGSDVAIRKSTTASVFQGGDTVTYTLAARNNGPATARNVVVADDVPATLDVVSVTPADRCTVTGNAVRCDLGSLAPNAERTVVITTRAKPVAASPASSSIAPKIKLTVEQEYYDLLPGQQREIDVQCKEGDVVGIASDATLQIVDITSGQQSTKDVQILQASAISTSSYRFVVKNNAAGTAQVRPHVTCLPAKTDDGQHDLVTGPLRTQTRTLAAGRHEFVFPLSGGDRAISPGVEATGGQVRLVGSEPVAGGWKLIVDVLEPATVTASLRDLDDWTSVSGDPAHAHQFVFDHVSRQVVVPANSRLNQQRVGCGVGYEGIVASYDLPAGVVSLGNIPMPINRDFDLLNTTGSDQTVTLDLECIRLQTGDALTADDLTNTATIATSTGDTNDANNRSSARILLERKPAPAPAPDPAPAPRPDPTPAPAPTPDPTPNPDPTPTPRPDTPATPSTPAAARASILSTALRVTGTTSRATIALPVRCAKACTGTATLRAISAVKGTTIKKNAVLGKVTLKLKAGKTTTVRLVAKGKVAKALRRKGIRTARLVVSTGKGTTVTKTVRFVVRK